MFTRNERPVDEGKEPAVKLHRKVHTMSTSSDPLRPIRAMDAAREADHYAKALSGLALVAETITATEAVLEVAMSLKPGREKFDALVGASNLQRDAYRFVWDIVDAMPEDTRETFRDIIESLELRVGNAHRTIMEVTA